MKRIDELEIGDGERTRRITLYQGDLARIPEDSPVDLLVVPARPDDYLPVPGTVIAALAEGGLSVAKLAANKAQDLREISGFWISQPLDADLAHLHIARVACFEPRIIGQPPQVVGELFRGLFPFLDAAGESVVAMPLLAAGKQGWRAEQMFVPLVEAACHWLRRGMPITELRFVELDARKADRLASQLRAIAHDLGGPERPPTVAAPAPAAAARPWDWLLPGRWLQRWRGREPQVAAQGDVAAYDVFLSYAEEDQAAAAALTQALRGEMAGISVFDYRLSVDVGKSWQQEIDAAIEHCDHIIALMSPHYFASPECKEELMIARLRNKRSDFSVFFPVYWKDAGKDLALWLQAITYSDCREADSARLGSEARRLAAQVLAHAY